MNSEGGDKEQATVSISPVQPGNSNLRSSEFEFGNHGNNDNNKRNDAGVKGNEEKQEPMLQADSVSSHEKEKEWTEVQRKGKKKNVPDHKKHNLKMTATKPITTGSAGRVGNPTNMLAASVGRSMLNRATIHSRDAKKVNTQSSAPATSTPAPLHPHKRRRPPSLQNSPTEKELEVGDDTLKSGDPVQPLKVETISDKATVRHGGGSISLSLDTGVLTSDQGNSSALSSAVSKAHMVDQGKDSIQP
ncbi:hypothetical protein PIB30_043161 [Stylosanthes scabra]|uniref:Uncharacterized protein n=1 Tax=Stylosanthes scabra TaxID=79078 RepID=A0ABU6RFG9_9FABA|nr:hypothetical protein [Stylosanthes scabra]